MSSRDSARPSSGQWISPQLLSAFRVAGTSAHRIFSAPDAWIERFGDDLLLSYKTDSARDSALVGLHTWCTTQTFEPRRVFARFLPKLNDERTAPTLLEGDRKLPLTSTVEERGVKYTIDFGAGYSVGFFIDQRANRAFLRRLGAKRLLNTFSYTCSFSVSAALAGSDTLSVDLSKKSLDRGRENFALNSLDTSSAAGKHRFVADDVLDVLPRLARKGETFDAIVLDPPTFSRGNRGRKFQVEKDLEGLLLSAMEVAAPQARILLSTNCTKIARRELEQIARYALKATRRSATFHQEPALPDFPSDAGAITLWLLLR